MPSPLEVALPPVTSAQPIRSSMDKALTDTLAKLPPSGGRGLVQLDVTTTGARGELAVRVGRGVTAAAWAGLAWGQNAEAGARVHWRF